MNADRSLIALTCKLSPGIFSGERVFEVRLANGETYTSVAPRFFCWNGSGVLVGETEPEREADGMVAAHLIEDLEGGQVAVEVPDGEVIAVDQAQVTRRPTPIVPPSPTSIEI